MTWTTPRTWSSGEVMDAADLNLELNQNPLHIYNGQVDLFPTFADVYKTWRGRSMFDYSDSVWDSVTYVPYAQDIADGTEVDLRWNYVKWSVTRGVDVQVVNWTTYDGKRVEYIDPAQRWSDGYYVDPSAFATGSSTSFGMFNVHPNDATEIHTIDGTGIYLLIASVAMSDSPGDYGVKLWFYLNGTVRYTHTQATINWGSGNDADQNIQGIYVQNMSSSVVGSTGYDAWKVSFQQESGSTVEAKSDGYNYGAASRFQLYKLGETT